MRVTSRMMVRNYNSRLNKVLGNLDVANQKVTTNGRSFLTASESPADAARAYRLRRTYIANEDYISNVKNTSDTLKSVEENLMSISKLAETAYVKSIEALNGTHDDYSRSILAREIRSLQESAVMNLNAQFDNKFLFAGTGTKGLPFELTTDDDGNQTLTYRGVNVLVDTPDPADYPGGETDPDYLDAVDAAAAHKAQLDALANETIYVDLGFGLREDANGVVKSSAYNTALPGISVIGYGDDPNANFILNLGRLADLFDAGEPLDDAAIKECTDALDEHRMNILINVTKLGSDTQFLDQTLSVLEDNEYNLNVKIKNVEFDDMEEAIMNFKEADYIYRAALKMGMSILSPSFIDFMD